MKKKDPTSHRIIEKRRRDRMNNCLADLSKLIPAHYMKKGRGRIEKTEIIELAIRHLKDLIEGQQHDGSSSHTQQVANRGQVEESHQSQQRVQQHHHHHHHHHHPPNHRPTGSLSGLSQQGPSNESHLSHSHPQPATSNTKTRTSQHLKGSPVAEDQSQSSSGSDNDSANSSPLATASCSSSSVAGSYRQTGSQAADSSGSESSGSSRSSISSTSSTTFSTSSSSALSSSSSPNHNHQKSTGWYKKAWITRSNHLRSPQR